MHRRLFLIAGLCLVGASAVHATLPIPRDLGYRDMVEKCRQGDTQFNSNEFANGLAGADKALKSAVKDGGRSQIEAVKLIIKDLKRCKVDKLMQFPRANDSCEAFNDAMASFAYSSASLIAGGYMTEADSDAIKESLRPAAQACMEKLMTQCVKPDAESFKEVRTAWENASAFGLHMRPNYDEHYKPLPPKDENDEDYQKGLRFCSDTDYACKGDKKKCAKRHKLIDEMLRFYSTVPDANPLQRVP